MTSSHGSTAPSQPQTPITTIESTCPTQLSTVTSSTVINNGGGGVFVNDNGPVNPGTTSAGAAHPVASTGDNVTSNTISGNFGSCAIVSDIRQCACDA